MNLRWEVEADKCEKPIQFNMDIALQIQGRDRSGKFSTFRKLLYPSGKRLSKYSGVFLVHLKPPMTRRLSQLWRLNTATKRVHGEEFLGNWKPRGVSLVNDFRQMQERIQKKQQATVTKQILFLKQAEEINKSDLTEEDKEQLLKKVIDLWTLKLGTDQEVFFFLVFVL
jgi:kinesin family protein 1